MKIEIKELISNYCQGRGRPEGIASVIKILGSAPKALGQDNGIETVNAARVLEACALTEVFSMLCARPCGGIASLRVLLVPGCGVPVADLLPSRIPYTLQAIDPAKCGVIFDVQAEFGQLITESEVHFEDYHGEDRSELMDNWCSRRSVDRYVPEKILTASPHPLSVKILAMFPEDGIAEISEEELCYKGPLAVIRNKRTVQQWLDRFEIDRWYENDLTPGWRLKDEFDFRAWSIAVGELS